MTTTAEFFTKTGDTLPRIESTLTDGAGTAVDIGQAEVFLSVQRIGVLGTLGEVVLADEPAVNDQVGDGSDGSMGQVHYDWQVGDTDLAGGYWAEWKVVFVNGGIMTFPNNGYDTIAIIERLGDLGS